MKPIFIGSDHAGFKLKQEVVKYLSSKKISFIDIGNNIFDKNDDYPDFGEAVAEATAKTKSMGVLICGSSFGVCIVANKVKGIRAVSISNVTDAKKSREHNDANVICLSGWNLKSTEANKIIAAFLSTKRSSELRHVKRIRKITQIESKKFQA